MKIAREYCGLEYLETWQGATATKNEIIKLGLAEEFDELIENYFDLDIVDEYELNDFLWFGRDEILERLGVALDENCDIIKNDKLTA